MYILELLTFVSCGTFHKYIIGVSNSPQETGGCLYYRCKRWQDQEEEAKYQE